MNAKTLLNKIVSHDWFPQRENEYLRWYPKQLKAYDRHFEFLSSEISGAYIHVPFCDKLCSFCPYYKRKTARQDVDAYILSLCREIELTKQMGGRGTLQFVYFGGGSPSVLHACQVDQILSVLNSSYSIANDAEISVEMHPTHVRVDTAEGYRATGVNRVSLGIQSFNGDHLASLGATHSVADSHLAIKNAFKVFDDVALDLLYAYDQQEINDWKHDLATAVDVYGVQHLSCYPLVSPSSQKHGFPRASEVEYALTALDYINGRGLQHYASCASGGFDAASPSRQCQYELKHWSAPQVQFLGLGPGAFGYVANTVTVNHASLANYISIIAEDSLPYVSASPVSSNEMEHRYFTLGVKTLTVPLEPFRCMFGCDPIAKFKRQFDYLQASEMAEIRDDCLELTPLGRLFVDQCSRLFFSHDEQNTPHPEEVHLAILGRRSHATR